MVVFREKLLPYVAPLMWFLPGALAGARVASRHGYGVGGFIVGGLGFAAVAFGFAMEEQKVARGVVLLGLVTSVSMALVLGR